MKLLIAALAIAAVVVPSTAFSDIHARRISKRVEALRQADAAAVPPSMPPAHYHTTAVDHFDAENHATYEQRFFVNETFWTKPDGPVFLYIEVRH